MVKKVKTVKNNNLYNTIGKNISIFLLLLQLGVVVTTFLLYFLNKDKNTPEFLDAVLIPLNKEIRKKDEFKTTENFNNTNNKLKKITKNDIINIEDTIKNDTDMSEEDKKIIYEPVYNPINSDFISPVRNQLLCGSCHFFSNCSQISDCINKKYNLTDTERDDCSKEEQCYVSIQQMMDRVEKNRINNKELDVNPCNGSSTSDFFYLVDNENEKLKEDVCNFYKYSAAYSVDNFLKFRNSDMYSITEQFSNNKNQNKSNKIRFTTKTKLIIFISVFAIIMICFSLYTMNYTDYNNFKKFITIINIFFSLASIALFFVLLNKSLRISFRKWLVSKIYLMEDIFIYVYVSVALIISLINIINISANLYKYFKTNYKYTKHENIFSFIILCFSLFIIYMFHGFKDRKYIDYLNVNNLDVENREFNDYVDILEKLIEEQEQKEEKIEEQKEEERVFTSIMEELVSLIQKSENELEVIEKEENKDILKYPIEILNSILEKSKLLIQEETEKINLKKKELENKKLELNFLKSQLQKEIDNNSISNEKLEEINKNITDIESKITEGESKILETESKISEIQTKITETESKITETESKIAEVETETESENTENKEELYNTILTFIKDTIILGKDIVTVIEENRDLLVDIDKLEEDLMVILNKSNNLLNLIKESEILIQINSNDIYIKKNSNYYIIFYDKNNNVIEKIKLNFDNNGNLDKLFLIDIKNKFLISHFTKTKYELTKLTDIIINDKQFNIEFHEYNRNLRKYTINYLVKNNDNYYRPKKINEMKINVNYTNLEKYEYNNCNPHCKNDNEYIIKELYYDYSETPTYFSYMYIYDPSNYKNRCIFLKYLIIKFGGFIGSVNVYDKEYFSTKDILYYTPPYNNDVKGAFKESGGHAMHVVGWIKIDENNINNIFKNNFFNENIEDLYGDYWIVKNSWGTERGDKGYLYIRMFDDKIFEKIKNKISPSNFNELYYKYNFIESEIICFNADKI